MSVNFSLLLGPDESFAISKLAEMDKRRRGDYLRCLIMKEAKRKRLVFPKNKSEPTNNEDVGDVARV